MTPRRSGFDALAPHYWWLERLSFGGLLQWCRTAHLPRLTGCRRALVVGDGDGRFLAAFLRANPEARIDCLDISPGMVALARRRLGPGERPRVRFAVGDVRSGPLPGDGYDLVVTNFLLDCFPAPELAEVVARLAAASAPGALWAVGDFALPALGWRRLAARAALAVMYGFFRAAAGLNASELIDPSPLLRGHGFAREAESTRLAGFLSATLWRRG